MCLELDIRSDRGTKSNVVVNLAVHGEDNLLVFAHERLGSGIWGCMSILQYALAFTDEQNIPTPTIASRSCTNTDSLPTKQPDQSGPRWRCCLESAMHLGVVCGHDDRPEVLLGVSLRAKRRQRTHLSYIAVAL
jgi:hypothetical protein